MTLTTISASSRASCRLPVGETDSGIDCPGRNNSLMRRSEIESRTSFSCAHNLIWCVPRRPSTMARLVPHAPAPMIAIRLIGFSSLLLPPKTCFRPGQKPSDILLMLGDDEERSNCHQDENLRHLTIVAQEPRDQRKQRNCDNRTKRYMAKYHHDCDKDTKHEQYGFGRQQSERPESGRYTFASPKLEPNREDMSNDGEKRSYARDHIPSWKKGAGEDNRRKSLQRV